MSQRILIALCATAAVSYGSLLLGSSLYIAALRRRLRRHAKLLTVNGQSINVSVLGDGEVTVVLDAGLGMSTISWHWIASIVASKARVVMFDRPALGCSPVSSFASVGLPSSQCYDKGDSAERVPWLRAVGDIVSLMHDVLDSIDAARGAGRGRRKLVLVGHSTAGMDVRLYCHRHGDEVKGLVLVDTASERQLNLLQGTSVYNTYPDVEETEAKLTRVRYLWRNGLFLPMYILSGPTFAKLCWYFPPLISLLRFFDSLGRAAAVQVRQNVKMLGPHLPKALLSQFMDEQLSPDGMEAMLAEHGSQRASMNYMLSLDLLKAGVLGSRPLTGTQFTCCTSTKVQILTPEELRARRARRALSVYLRH